MQKRLSLFTFLAKCLRLVSQLFSKWGLLLVAAFFLSPVGPHLRAEYTYYSAGNTRIYLRCTYLGSRGFITPDFRGDCPVIAMLDSREWR